MKQLYIRKGNSRETRDILIIGEEETLGSRDSSGYRPSKGSVFSPLVRTDPYSGGTGLTYIHAVPNIPLNTEKYQRDYAVHMFVKAYCSDLVSWDGETSAGRVRSREAFVCKNGNAQKTADELYHRIYGEIHGHPGKHVVALRVWKGIFTIIRALLSVVFIILVSLLMPKRSRKIKWGKFIRTGRF